MPNITPEEIAKWEAACDGPLVMPKQLNQFTAIARTALPRLLAERTQLIERVAEMEAGLTELINDTPTKVHCLSVVFEMRKRCHQILQGTKQETPDEH